MDRDQVIEIRRLIGIRKFEDERQNVRELNLLLTLKELTGFGRGKAGGAIKGPRTGAPRRPPDIDTTAAEAAALNRLGPASSASVSGGRCAVGKVNPTSPGRHNWLHLIGGGVGRLVEASWARRPAGICRQRTGRAR